MSTIFCALIVASTVEANKEELKKLHGTWLMVSAEANGEVHLAKELQDQGLPKQLKIAGDRIDPLLGAPASRFSIDPAKNPKHLDVANGDDADRIKWIYALDGDNLKMAVTFDFKLFGGAPDTSRPKSFATKGNKVIVITLKRENK